MRRLYLDIGNSRIKIARADQGLWETNTVSLEKEALNLRSKLPKMSEDLMLILTSVRKDTLELVKNEISGYHYTVLDKNWLPNGLLDYQTKPTLGLDRYLSCLGAVTKANNAVIVIDAGSAITIDYMSLDKVFKGGVIIPGQKVVLGAMNKILPELPKPDGDIPDQFPGKSTLDCIRWGVNGSYQSIMDNFLSRYDTLTHQNVVIFLTGGDSEYISTLISKRWQVTIDQHLMFEGMKHYLNLFKPQ